MRQPRNSNQSAPDFEPRPDRRIVCIDIETVALDPADAKGALDALRGRIVCIGLLINDGERVEEIAFCDNDERLMIAGLWDSIKPGDVLVGHNVLEFDLLFIRQRSWILGIKPSRTLDTRKFYSADVIDTMQLWTNWGHKKGAKLDALGVALGCGGKTGNGADVAGWWTQGHLQRIKSYCQEDVRLAYRVFCRLTYQESKLIAGERESNPGHQVAEVSILDEQGYDSDGAQQRKRLSLSSRTQTEESLTSGQKGCEKHV